MLITCTTCPPGALPTVQVNSCEFAPAKAAKLFIQKLDDTNNSFVDGVNAINLSASWSALPTATDNTKISITPFLLSYETGEQTKLEDGENFDGAPNLVSPGVQLVTAEIRNPNPDDIRALQELAKCQTAQLSFYWIDAQGNFIAREITTGTYAGIPISQKTLFVSDYFRGATKADQGRIQIQFYLPEGWSNDLAIVAPESGFNPLTDVTP